MCEEKKKKGSATLSKGVREGFSAAVEKNAASDFVYFFLCGQQNAEWNLWLGISSDEDVWSIVR